MTFFVRGAWLVACASLAACGGKVQGPDSTTGTSTGAAGSSGPIFGGGTSGTTGSSTPTSPAGGSTTPPSPDISASCQAICDRVAQAGCPVNCLEECTGPVATHPGCTAELDAALRCFARTPIQCNTNGQGAEFFGCDHERDLVSQCIAPPTPPPPSMPPMPVPTQPIPPQCVGGAPVPPSGMVCSGGGASSGGGSTGTGGNAPPTCEAQCGDATGNVWSSYCVGVNCSCLYNGTAYCSCVSNTACSSCCPGI